MSDEKLTINSVVIQDLSLYRGVEFRVNGHYVGDIYPNDNGRIYLNGNITTSTERFENEWYFVIDLKSRPGYEDL